MVKPNLNIVMTEPGNTVFHRSIVIQCIEADEVVDILADVLVKAAVDVEPAAETTMEEEAAAEALEPHPLMESTYLIPIACFLILNGTVLAEKGVTMSLTIVNNSQEEADVDIAEDAVTKDAAEADEQLKPSNLTMDLKDKATNRPARTLVRLEMIVEAVMDADLDAVPMEAVMDNGDYLGRQR
mmetsp:Transcript_6862/g.12588  ORF Transcript_6862/g.12588 Transcript_6862/m.12588 type:complete len:184 (-) Transcript_6862:3541-4092(-)